LRFWLYVAMVLGLPSLTFVALQPTTHAEAEPGMLVLIVVPALAGFLVTRGLDRREPAAPWSVMRGVLLGSAVTLVIVGVSLALAVATGAARLTGEGAPEAAIGAIGAAVVTGTLEELGWAGGGLQVARNALGRWLGVGVLGLVWAAWHLQVAALAPAQTAASLFPRGDPFAPGPLVGFIFGCVAYRFLLTELRDASRSPWPAVAAHATGNIALGGLLAAGALVLPPEGPWVTFPSVNGIVFPIGALVAAALVHRATHPRD